jgi:hypothetical protein
MKKHRYMLFVLITLCSFISLSAQNLTDEQKHQIINALSITSIDSAYTYNYAPKVVEAVIEYEIVEAVPALISNFWIQKSYTQIRFLVALLQLGSGATESLALEYIDSLGTFHDTNFTKLQLKVHATEVLFDLGNFSTYQYVFDRIEETKPQIIVNPYLLQDIIINIPQEAEHAKNELINVATDGREPYLRSRAYSILVVNYGEEILPFIIRRFSEEVDISNRISMVNYIFPKYKNQLVF